MSKLTQYFVLNAVGEKEIVFADDWECGGNGLKFYRNGGAVAWYAEWKGWRKADPDELRQDLLKQIENE